MPSVNTIHSSHCIASDLESCAKCARDRLHDEFACLFLEIGNGHHTTEYPSQTFATLDSRHW